MRWLNHIPRYSLETLLGHKSSLQIPLEFLRMMVCVNRVVNMWATGSKTCREKLRQVEAFFLQSLKVKGALHFPCSWDWSQGQCWQKWSQFFLEHRRGFRKLNVNLTMIGRNPDYFKYDLKAQIRPNHWGTFLSSLVFISPHPAFCRLQRCFCIHIILTAQSIHKHQSSESSPPKAFVR